MPTSSARKGLRSVVSVSRAIGAAGSVLACRRCTSSARAAALVISWGCSAGRGLAVSLLASLPGQVPRYRLARALEKEVLWRTGALQP